MVLAVEFRRVTRRFDTVEAVSDVDLTVEEGAFFTLLGPSGSGKTTCLRLISGFERPTSGEIRIFDKVFNDVPPNRRPVNTVFQDYALFPHLDVRDNVAYGLMVRGIGRQQRHAEAEMMLDLVKLGGFGGRSPAQLSGGQRQRVALARALINKPRVLLLDEPLGALDLKLREQMQEELKSLQETVGITFVFVTHDQGEALSMSDHIAVINSGCVVQCGSPQQIYNLPRTRFVAGFVGSSNLLSPDLSKSVGAASCWHSLRPEAIRVVSAERAQASGRIRSVRYLGSVQRVQIKVGQHSIDAMLPASFELPEQGARIHLGWPSEALNPLRDDA